MRARDSQLSKYYRAIGEIPRPAFMPTLSEAQNYIKAVISDGWFKKEFPHVVTCRAIQGRSYARVDESGVLIVPCPPWARNAFSLLQLIAHALIPNDAAYHGREFAGILMKLMKHNADDGGASLKVAFEKHNVKYKPKRKRKPPTPEQLEELKKRLVVARVIRRIKRAVAS
jgi:hypothetical protein